MRLIINLSLLFTTSIITDFRGGRRAWREVGGVGGRGRGGWRRGREAGMPLSPSPFLQVLEATPAPTLSSSSALLWGLLESRGTALCGFERLVSWSELGFREACTSVNPSANAYFHSHIPTERLRGLSLQGQKEGLFYMLSTPQHVPWFSPLRKPGRAFVAEKVSFPSEESFPLLPIHWKFNV